MKAKLIPVITAILLLFGKHIANAADAANKPKEVTAESKPEKPKLTQQELEAKFKATLTDATMSGRWCSVTNGKLGPEKEDKYTIVGVSKLDGDSWIVRARIQYGKVDVIAPIPVQVKWAGDTPVLVVDNMKLGEGAAYTARVLIYDNTYAGTWSGGDHGGLMNGTITQKKESDSKE